ncbi:TIGR04283 family arsenosugar biosynthesis glycosyltransferase [Kaustia mangrovi]|nr:TIGR04283 family arsenosugar biosynthesis glycosyltransferase [Kaustia mangrovi]
MLHRIMLTVVIPTLNAAGTLVPVLSSLVPGVISGLVKQLVVVDGGSHDETLDIADAAGGDIVRAKGGRGGQLAAGADAARGEWLLFLHADTLLEPGWEHEVRRFIEETQVSGDAERAAVFRFRLDDRGAWPRLLERIVGLRYWLMALPYGDQGLLISRAFYERLGGYSALPLMEDVDLVRRIGRRHLTRLAHTATTSADRYRREGYPRRMARNALCLTLYAAGVSLARIKRLYG